eukprot:g36998.t1
MQTMQRHASAAARLPLVQNAITSQIQITFKRGVLKVRRVDLKPNRGRTRRIKTRWQDYPQVSAQEAMEQWFRRMTRHDFMTVPKGTERVLYLGENEGVANIIAQEIVPKGQVLRNLQEVADSKQPVDMAFCFNGLRSLDMSAHLQTLVQIHDSLRLGGKFYFAHGMHFNWKIAEIVHRMAKAEGSEFRPYFEAAGYTDSIWWGPNTLTAKLGEKFPAQVYSQCLEQTALYPLKVSYYPVHFNLTQESELRPLLRLLLGDELSVLPEDVQPRYLQFLSDRLHREGQVATSPNRYNLKLFQLIGSAAKM